MRKREAGKGPGDRVLGRAQCLVHEAAKLLFHEGCHWGCEGGARDGSSRVGVRLKQRKRVLATEGCSAYGGPCCWQPSRQVGSIVMATVC